MKKTELDEKGRTQVDTAKGDFFGLKKQGCQLAVPLVQPRIRTSPFIPVGACFALSTPMPARQHTWLFFLYCFHKFTIFYTL